MKRFLAIKLLVPAILLVGISSTGGCVSRAEYDKALAACRNANEQLLNSQQALRAVRAENQKLGDELKARDAIIESRKEEIALLEAAKNDLRKDFDNINALYKKLLADRQAPPMLGPITVLPALVDKSLRAFARENPDLLEYLPQYGMVKFKSDLTFEPGSDFVKPAAKDALAEFVKIVNSQAAAKFNIYIAGHTDDMPIGKPGTRRRHPSNWYLSVHRAVAVQSVLTKAGLAAERIGAMGFGQYHPIAPNAPGKKGNRLNRRVEIWIVPPDRFLTESAPVETEPEK